ncbi:MAG: hypothetical protein JNJ98_00700 [Gemmatimonadetes bacterium]|nr:hypothetical protein [Gemmatimonadota bacterium]
MTPPMVFQAVLYAKELRVLREFYQAVLSLAFAEEGRGFVLLSGRGYELSVVQIPEAYAAEIQIASPPVAREDTPIKLSFPVPDIAGTRPEIARLGGTLQPDASAWEWRGCRHLDGTDPEGNVFQLREPCGPSVPAT